MAQHDYDIANASGAVVRADLNDVLDAVATNNSGATAPSTTFAHQWWFDSSTLDLKQRNSANTAWVLVARKDGNGWTPYRQGTQLGDAAVATVGTASGNVPDADDVGLIATSREWSAAQNFDEVTLTPGTSDIDWDADTDQVASVTLDGNYQLNLPSNLRQGMYLSLRVIQDGTGGHTLTYGAGIDWGTAGAPTLTVTGDRSDLLTFYAASATKLFGLSAAQGYDES